MNQGLNNDKPVVTSDDNRKRPTKNKTWVWVGIIIVLLGINIYLFSTKNKVSSERDHMAQTMEYIAAERDELSAEYDAAIARLDMLLTKNTELDSLLSQKDSEISQLKEQIRKILSDSRATASDLARAKNLIASLSSRVKSYEERIAELEYENAALSGKNKLLEAERDSTVSDNIALQQKLRLGAVLHASRINMTPIELRRQGKKEKTTGKAKRVDILRVQFDIDENRIAEDGIKDLYLCITGPDGRLLSNAAYGSGVTETFDGKPLPYTMAKQIDLKQGEAVKDIVVDWHQDSDYSKGNYMIQIYHQGFLIGSGNVVLR